MRAPISRSGRTTLTTVAISAVLAASMGLMATARAEEQEVPVISSFTAMNIYGDIWAFSGTVTGCTPVSGLTVTFSGLLQGETTTTASDGSFYFEFDLNGGSGTVGAIATSTESIDSEEEYTEAG